MNAGKHIFQLDTKLKFAAMVLYEARLIDQPDIMSFSKRIGVKYRTLQSASNNSRITITLENAICDFCGINPSDPSWHDGSTSLAEKKQYSTYQGTDKAVDFELRLRSIHLKSLPAWKVRETEVTSNPNLPHHCISVSFQFDQQCEDIPVFWRLKLIWGILTKVIPSDLMPSNWKYIIQQILSLVQGLGN